MAIKLTRYEQETIINFNAADKTAELYTRDPAIIRQLDSLVSEYPDTFKCVGETDIDKTYVMPKTAVTYRKPRRLSEEQREAAKKRMNALNNRNYSAGTVMMMLYGVPLTAFSIASNVL